MKRKTRFAIEVSMRYLGHLGICFLGAACFIWATSAMYRWVVDPVLRAKGWWPYDC